MAANQFDFQAFNKMMYGVGSGLKLHLAIQLIRDCALTYERFNNELEADCRSVLTDMKELQVAHKAQAAARTDKTGKLMASDGQSE